MTRRRRARTAPKPWRWTAISSRPSTRWSEASSDQYHKARDWTVLAGMPRSLLYWARGRDRHRGALDRGPALRAYARAGHDENAPGRAQDLVPAFQAGLGRVR